MNTNKKTDTHVAHCITHYVSKGYECVSLPVSTVQQLRTVGIKFYSQNFQKSLDIRVGFWYNTSSEGVGRE